MCTTFINRRGLLRLAAAAGLSTSTGLTGRALAQPRIGTRYRTKAGTWGALLIVAAMFYSPPVLAQTGVPKYEVDPFWPKLPNNWVVGPLGGTCVDTRDHVFVLHRQEELTEAVLTARDQFAGGAARIKAPARDGVRPRRQFGQFLGRYESSWQLPPRLSGG